MSKRLLILGASGMLGSALLRYFVDQGDMEVSGTARTFDSVRNLSERARDCVKLNVDVEKPDHLLKVFADVRPDIVVNCVGIVKQLAEVEPPSTVISLNSLLPHRLAKLCTVANARLIHFSTDCVFSGVRGMYKESDSADAADLYGRSKLIGEVNYRGTITLRTSIVGHELSGNRSLIGWFLTQTGSVKGFRQAVFSGLPTVEIARVIHQLLLPNPNIWGLYHLSADPISKFELLSLVARVYGKKIKIIPDDNLLVDRSLDSSCFRSATGFSPKSWTELVQAMHNFG